MSTIWFSLAFLCGQTASASTLPVQATTNAPTQDIGAHHFTVAAGHRVSLAMVPGLVDRPISAAFDEKGRLFVTESSGSNEPAAVQAKSKPHRILRLEDTDGDGVFDKRSIFADNLMLPQGIMVFRGEVWTGTPPQIWRLVDTDDDGVADKRMLFHDGGTLTGCMNDLHGPVAGPDGRIYWTKGAFAEQKHKIDGKPFVTKACHVFSARPDGSDLRVHMTGGMDNPVGIAFSRLGELFVSCTFVHHPHLGLRDGIIHPTPGIVFGKDHAPIQDPFHIRTGPGLGTPLVEMGPAAPCGMISLEHPDNEFVNRLACCQFNLKKVSLHALSPKGAGLEADSTNLIVSDYKDFHPTDVVEDADGSILVIDTGGWYKLCCPSSQMVKDESRGAIYRIRKETGKAKPIVDPRGNGIDWSAGDEGISLLTVDPRPVVAKKAVEVLVKRKAVKELASIAKNPRIPEAARFRAIWGLGMIDDDRAGTSLRELAEQGDIPIQIAILKALITQGKKDSGDIYIRNMVSEHPTLARVAAEGIGRVRASQALKPLMDRLGSIKDDPILTRALTFALIQVLDGEPSQAEVLLGEIGNLKLVARTAVLVALDQAGHLKNPDAVWSLLKQGDKDSRSTALWIISHHPEWGGPLASLIQKDPKVLGPDTLGSLAGSAEIANLLATMASAKASDLQKLAMEAMARAGVSKVPSSWVEPISLALAGLNSEAGLMVARSINGPIPPKWLGEIESIAADEKRKPAQRLAALAILPPGRAWEGGNLELLVSGLHRDRGPRERTDALTALARGRVAPGQSGRISLAIPTASPADIGRILDLFSSNRGEEAGLALVDALKQPEIVAVVSPAMARAILDRHGQKVRDAAGPVLAKIEPNRADEARRISEYTAQLPKGDSARGHIVFNGQKAACAGCHKLGYVGGDTGPDLSRIGQIRTKADLLESILAPSASFVRSYEPVVVTTKSGRLVTGIVQSDGPEGVQLAVGPSAVERIARDQIEELSPGKVSVMPAGLEKQLTPQEMADLLEFLLQRK